MYALTLFVAEVFAVPVQINRTFAYEDLEPLPPRVFPSEDAPAVYHMLQQLPARAVVVEFPFGIDGVELRYMFYSTIHWRRLLNGYSGGFPKTYLRNRAALLHLRSDPDEAWAILAESGATHAVVHTSAYPRSRRAMVGHWLREHGARLLRRVGNDLVFELPVPAPAQAVP